MPYRAAKTPHSTSRGVKLLICREAITFELSDYSGVNGDIAHYLGLGLAISFPKFLASACKGEPLPLYLHCRRTLREAKRRDCLTATIPPSQIL